MVPIPRPGIPWPVIMITLHFTIVYTVWSCIIKIILYCYHHINSASIYNKV